MKASKGLSDENAMKISNRTQPYTSFNDGRHIPKDHTCLALTAAPRAARVTAKTREPAPIAIHMPSIFHMMLYVARKAPCS